MSNRGWPIRKRQPANRSQQIMSKLPLDEFPNGIAPQVNVAVASKCRISRGGIRILQATVTPLHTNKSLFD